MTKCRIPLICLLIGFCFHALEVEIREGMMWSSMIRNSGPDISWLEAADRALSSEAPCSGCRQITRERVTGESESGFTAPIVPDQDLIAQEINQGVPDPALSHLAYACPPFIWRSQPASPPAPPPV